MDSQVTYTLNNSSISPRTADSLLSRKVFFVVTGDIEFSDFTHKPVVKRFRRTHLKKNSSQRKHAAEIDIRFERTEA